MILVKACPLGEPAERLLIAVAARGHRVLPGPEALDSDAALDTDAALDSNVALESNVTPEADVTLVISDGPAVLNLLSVVRALGNRRFRVLVLSRLGAHPDARAASLRRLWRLEEHVRGGGAPTLTLRLAPLVGPETPLWRKLRSRPALPNGGRKLVNPVAERDVVETLLRALGGRVTWNDWYEVAGGEVISLAELRDVAARTHGGTSGGEWEPTLEEIAEHRLAESEPWATAFGITPTPLAAWTREAVA